MKKKWLAGILVLLGVLGGEFLFGQEKVEEEDAGRSYGKMKFEIEFEDWEDWGVEMKSEVIILKNINASEIEAFIESRLSPFGTVQVNDAANMVIITDKIEKAEDLARLVRIFDEHGVKDFLRLETEAIVLENVPPSTLEDWVKAQLSKEGSLLVNVEHNQLIITDRRSKIERIKKIVKKLDLPTPQVALLVKIVELNEDYVRSVGIDWDSLTGILPRLELSWGENWPFENFEDVRFRLGNFTVNQWDNLINFLVKKGKGKVLSSAKLLTLNNRTVKVTSRERIYGEEETSTEPGVYLTLTPSIYKNKKIRLAIFTQLVSLVGWSRKGNPLTSTKESENVVDLLDGDTYLLSGLKRTNVVTSSKRIPFLGWILPGLFSKEVKTEYTNQVLIFITPQLVKTAEDTYFPEEEK